MTHLYHALLAWPTPQAGYYKSQTVSNSISIVFQSSSRHEQYCRFSHFLALAYIYIYRFHQLNTCLTSIALEETENVISKQCTRYSMMTQNYD
jgi:hypothetical protein